MQVRNGVGVKNCILQATESNRISISTSLTNVFRTLVPLVWVFQIWEQGEKEPSYEFILTYLTSLLFQCILDRRIFRYGI